jgi:hypothetical protein
MRSKDPNNESSRDILKKIEENILLEYKKKTSNENYLKFLENENKLIESFFNKNEALKMNLNFETTFKAIEKTEGLLTKW